MGHDEPGWATMDRAGQQRSRRHNGVTEDIKALADGDMSPGFGFKKETYKTGAGPREGTIEEQSTLFGYSITPSGI
ncbi:MAG: hypothetical protein ACYC0L_01460 [Thermoleophilia bacterium]